MLQRFKAWLKTILFYEILVGMKATMKHLLHYKPITLQYPHEKRTLPDSYRGMLALLRYDEPPDWIIPVRHALGAALMNAGRYKEAEQVFREDLQKWPDNGWSLFGLGRTLQHLGREADAAPVLGKFRATWSQADFELTSACLCLPGQ